MKLETKMREFLVAITYLLTDYPEKIKIVCWESDKNIVLEVYVDAQDVGKLLGKGGCIAKSIRTITTAAGARHKKTLRIVILGSEITSEENEKHEETVLSRETKFNREKFNTKV